MSAYQHFDEYHCDIIDALDMMYSNDEYTHTVETLEQAYKYGTRVYVMGNGGSAAVADHFLCDHMKGICSDTDSYRPYVKSLCSDTALITAIANDHSYEEIFSKQLEYEAYMTERPAVVVAMSVSGSSPNIVRAMRVAGALGYTRIALLGMDGGDTKRLNLYERLLQFPVSNYGVVEDCFSITMHAISQYIRKKHAADPTKVKL